MVALNTFIYLTPLFYNVFLPRAAPRIYYYVFQFLDYVSLPSQKID